MDISLPYNNGTLRTTLDWANVIATLRIAETPALNDPPTALRNGLASPIDAPPLSDQLRPGVTVLILVSDSFRKTAIDKLLPTLITYLNEHGMDDTQIGFLFAGGSHRPPTLKEQAEILGKDIFERFRTRAYTHDPDDADQLAYCGDTQRGTPVYLNRRALDADIVITTGTVVLHYFGGYGGGRKSILPGIAGTRSIAANHSLNLDPVRNGLNPDVSIGRLAGNPVAEDMLEGAKLVGNAFVINTVLNREGKIVQVFCGELEAAHGDACACAGSLFTVPYTEKADFVIASAGNAKNFVQSHKSLYNAFQVVRDGGLILLATPAYEGYGSERFVTWLRLGTSDAIIAELRKHAEINGQTALSTLEKARNAFLLTEMSDRDCNALGARKVSSLADGLRLIRQKLAQQGIDCPSCYIMPDAPFTVPVSPR